MKFWLIIAETLGTDGEYYTEVFTETTGQRAGEFATSLVATMCEDMDVQDVDPTACWELYGDQWFYRVRIQEEEI